jgi:hypothetical protein
VQLEVNVQYESHTRFGIWDLDYGKGAVLNTLGSPESKRAYEFAIDDFVSWYCSEPRLAFNKTVVLRYWSENGCHTQRLSEFLSDWQDIPFHNTGNG